MYYGPTRRNQPVLIPSIRPDERPMSQRSGNAALDGYTALSTASRESRYRPPVGGTPVYPSFYRQFEE